jgi:hypothetical protein
MKTLEIPKKTNSYGSKCRQIEGNEERTRDYKDMLYSYQKLWAQDADLINFHYLGSERILDSILELTRIDSETIPKDLYFDKILHRFKERDAQRANIVDIGNKLNTTVYIVAFLKNLQKYKIYNLTKDDGIWIEMNQAEHIAWHHKMRDYDFDEFLDFKPYYPKYI